MNKSIGVLGCGWLGLPLAQHLVELGYLVKGSVTNKEKQELLRHKNIQPFQIKVTSTTVEGDDVLSFLDVDTLIINFPPKTRTVSVDYYEQQMKLLISEINKSPIEQVLFVSSTAVYPETNSDVDEDETALPDSENGKVLLKVEKLLSSGNRFKTTVIRFGGLIGYDRQPGRFLAGKKDLDNGDSPVNLIHRDDCIALITALVQQNIVGETFNACSDFHPTRKEFYTEAAKKLNLEVPTFNKAGKNSFKIISSEKIKSRLKYSFKYPDPIETI